MIWFRLGSRRPEGWPVRGRPGARFGNGSSVVSASTGGVGSTSSTSGEVWASKCRIGPSVGVAGLTDLGIERCVARLGRCFVEGCRPFTKGTGCFFDTTLTIGKGSCTSRHLALNVSCVGESDGLTRDGSLVAFVRRMMRRARKIRRAFHRFAKS